MARKRFGVGQIIPLLREAEVALAKGQQVAMVYRQIGVSDKTYYRWRREYGGMKMDQAKRLRELDQENSRLKRLLADAELVNDLLCRKTHPSCHIRSAFLQSEIPRLRNLEPDRFKGGRSGQHAQLADCKISKNPLHTVCGAFVKAFRYSDNLVY